MKRIIFLLLVFFLVPFVLAVECEDVMRKNVPCEVITPANMSCSTYNMYDDSGTLIEGPVTMPELYSDTGIYSFEFNQTVEKGYLVHLCDGSLATIIVGKGNIVEKLEDDHGVSDWGGTSGHSIFEEYIDAKKFRNIVEAGDTLLNVVFYGSILFGLALFAFLVIRFFKEGD